MNDLVARVQTREANKSGASQHCLDRGAGTDTVRHGIVEMSDLSGLSGLDVWLCPVSLDAAPFGPPGDIEHIMNVIEGKADVNRCGGCYIGPAYRRNRGVHSIMF